jgi:hypothetical protein
MPVFSCGLFLEMILYKLKKQDMKNLIESIKSIKCAQVKILSTLLSAPFFKLKVFIHTEFDKIFRLEGDEKDNFEIAWTMLADDGLVYTDIHEIGIKADSLPFAGRLVSSLNDYINC